MKSALTIPKPSAAMVLAAGLGTRMRPLTDRTAKPLLPLGGRALLDHALDRLAAAGVQRTMVNAHWHADLVAAALNARAAEALPPKTILLREPLLLDTGGSVAAALPHLGDDPFFVVNGDAFWLDGPTPALDRLVRAFDPAEVDVVLLLHRTFQVQAETGFGDFAMDPWGMVRRREEREIVPYIYAGVQLAAPALFADPPPAPFSVNALWDRAIASGRARGMVHDGLWFHLSTPPDLSEAEQVMSIGATAETT